jgi:hypothetical protein
VGPHNERRCGFTDLGDEVAAGKGARRKQPIASQGDRALLNLHAAADRAQALCRVAAPLFLRRRRSSGLAARLGLRWARGWLGVNAPPAVLIAHAVGNAQLALARTCMPKCSSKLVKVMIVDSYSAVVAQSRCSGGRECLRLHHRTIMKGCGDSLITVIK